MGVRHIDLDRWERGFRVNTPRRHAADINKADEARFLEKKNTIFTKIFIAGLPGK